MSRLRPATGAISSSAGHRKSRSPKADGACSAPVGPACMLDPALNQTLRTNGEAAWFGWPTDDEIEALRTQWIKAGDSEARQEISAAIQQRAFETVPYIPTGAWKLMTAYRRNLKNLLLGPVIFQWSVEKV